MRHWLLAHRPWAMISLLGFSVLVLLLSGRVFTLHQAHSAVRDGLTVQAAADPMTDERRLTLDQRQRILNFFLAHQGYETAPLRLPDRGLLRFGTLPDGIARRELPDQLLRELGDRNDRYQYFIVGTSVIVIERTSNKIVDIVRDVVR